MVDVSSTGQSTTVRPNPNEEQGGAAPVRRRREDEQKDNNPTANVGVQDRVDIRQNRPQPAEGNAVAGNEGPAKGGRVAQAATPKRANPARPENPNQNQSAEKNPRPEKTDQANQRDKARQAREENIVTRPTGQSANQTEKPEAVRAAQRVRTEQVHGNRPANVANQNQGNRAEPNAAARQEEPPKSNEDIVKHNVPETKKNVQETAENLRRREMEHKAATEPAFSTPKTDIARINLSSPDNKNPRTPGLEGSVSEKAETAHVKHEEEQARFEQLKEKTRKNQDQQAQLVGNRNPVSVQTQVGRNVDKLI